MCALTNTLPTQVTFQTKQNFLWKHHTDRVDVRSDVYGERHYFKVESESAKLYFNMRVCGNVCRERGTAECESLVL